MLAFKLLLLDVKPNLIPLQLRIFMGHGAWHGTTCTYQLPMLECLEIGVEHSIFVQ
jgi:hypothetical protein